jgi:hypothetical protein
MPGMTATPGGNSGNGLENGRTWMRRLAAPFALAGMIVLGGCQNMDSDTSGRAVGGAALGAAGGAVIGALTGNWGKGAAIGALVGGASGVLYDQHQKGNL